MDIRDLCLSSWSTFLGLKLDLSSSSAQLNTLNDVISPSGNSLSCWNFFILCELISASLARAQSYSCYSSTAALACGKDWLRFAAVNICSIPHKNSDQLNTVYPTSHFFFSSDKALQSADLITNGTEHKISHWI